MKFVDFMSVTVFYFNAMISLLKFLIVNLLLLLVNNEIILTLIINYHFLILN